jgi:hypothetical protein
MSGIKYLTPETDHLPGPEKRKDFTHEGPKQLLSTPWLLAAAMGMPAAPAPKPARKCSLPGCNVMHTHNGGYCCADHCRQHRG